MKRYLILLFLIAGSMGLSAQTVVDVVTEPASPSAVDVLSAATPKYGYCNRQQIIESHPQYAAAKERIAALRVQYEKEAQRNETEFRRLFAEYLSGQKDFPQAILLKRQSDLQEAMEKGIAFRNEADALLRQAEADMMATLTAEVDAAIASVGDERGYECVFDTSAGQCLYLRPALSEDITTFVTARLQ